MWRGLRSCSRRRLRVQRWTWLCPDRNFLRKVHPKCLCWRPTEPKTWLSLWGRLARGQRSSVVPSTRMFKSTSATRNNNTSIKTSTSKSTSKTNSTVNNCLLCSKRIRTLWFVFLQVWPADSSGRLCGVSDAFPAHGGWGEASTAIWEGQKTSGGSERRRPLHDAVQSHWKTQSAHVDHDLHGQLQWQRPDVNSGKTDRETDRQVETERQTDRQIWPVSLCFLSATPRHDRCFSFYKIISEAQEDPRGQSLFICVFI